jgi:transcription elongation factor Elf1
MLSEKLLCPHCGDEKTSKEELLPAEVLAGHVIHLFCIKCGMGFEASVQDGQYLLEAIRAVDE